MRVAIRRTLRVGAQTAGTPVEDLGVVPDERHAMTRRDVLEGNLDLLDRAGAILAGAQTRRLAVFPDLDDDDTLTVEVETAGIDRIDAYIDDRPQSSQDVTGELTTITITEASGAGRVRIDGFALGSLVASRTVAIAADRSAIIDAGARAVVPAAGRPGALSGAVDRSRPTILYVHGAGNKPAQRDLKQAWDTDLFHRDMGDQTSMVYYADILHTTPGALGIDGCEQDDALAALVAGAVTAGLDNEATSLGAASVPVAPLQSTDVADFARTQRGKAFATRLAAAVIEHADTVATAPDPLSAVLPLPRFLRDLLLRELLRRIVPDAEAYFFNQRQRDRIQTRLRAAITAVQGPLIVVSHSLGSVITYDVLSEAAHAHRDVRLLITLGSPLGYTEIQDKVSQPLQVPGPVGRWTNVADPLDPVALDGQLNNDFRGGLDLVDLRVDNVGAANHAVCGYLRTAPVRSAVTAAWSVPS